MRGDVMRRNQNLYYLYHWDWEHTTEDCQTLNDHLYELEKAGYLGEFLVREDSHPQLPERGNHFENFNTSSEAHRGNTCG